MLAVGVATTLGPEVVFRSVAGAQEKVVKSERPVVTSIFTELPSHTEAAEGVTASAGGVVTTAITGTRAV